MKKSYLIIAAAALAMASCSKENIVDSVNDNETVAITFEQFVNKATKSEITNETALASADGFRVWGYKAKNVASGETIAWDNDDAKLVIFDDVQVSYASSEWSYSPLKFWDKTCSYRFYAGGPVAHTNGTLDCIASGDAYMKFTVEGAVSAPATESFSDFVIDRIVNQTNASTINDPTYREGFDFHHIMAKISFAVKKSGTLTASDDLVLTDIKMSGYNAASGDFEQKKFDGTWGVLNTSEWSQTATASGETVQLASGEALEFDAKETNLVKDYIMVPQQIAANTLKFTVSYTLNGEEFTDQEGTLANAQTWGTDSHVTYTITVGPQAILFDVNTVCSFCVASGDAISIE